MYIYDYTHFTCTFILKHCIKAYFYHGRRQGQSKWNMELVATPLITQGLLTIPYPGRDDHVEAFSYSCEEWRCDIMGVDMVMLIYWLYYIYKLKCCKDEHVQLGSICKRWWSINLELENGNSNFNCKSTSLLHWTKSPNSMYITIVWGQVLHSLWKYYATWLFLSILQPPWKCVTWNGSYKCGHRILCFSYHAL